MPAPKARQPKTDTTCGEARVEPDSVDVNHGSRLRSATDTLGGRSVGRYEKVFYVAANYRQTAGTQPSTHSANLQPHVPRFILTSRTVADAGPAA